MHGKYVDLRVYQHFVHTYTRVPYLDREIFNIGTDSLRQSRKAEHRSAAASEAIEKVSQQSENLANSLRDSRRKREEDAVKFIDEMKVNQQDSLRKAQLVWSRYEQQREESKLDHIKDQKYLQELLKTNSTKAESRLTSVRRWN